MNENIVSQQIEISSCSITRDTSLINIIRDIPPCGRYMDIKQGYRCRVSRDRYSVTRITELHCIIMQMQSCALCVYCGMCCVYFPPQPRQPPQARALLLHMRLYKKHLHITTDKNIYEGFERRMLVLCCITCTHVCTYVCMHTQTFFIPFFFVFL